MSVPGRFEDQAGEATPRSALLLAMQGITKTFGETEVLTDVDFDLRAGEVHALLGENGAGKSTLMKILMGVHRADSGQVLLDGVDVTDQSVQGKLDRGITMIFQELSLLPNLTVAENLCLAESRAGWAGASISSVSAARRKNSSTPTIFRSGPPPGSRTSVLHSARWSRSSRHWRAAPGS